ncbi:MAG TPA: hypothetical protein VGQ39_06755 [Pyrinomonadaceae bacterium]|jgi:hypothetical protein|nr:hypothetical protein [Pyrinomonadaceae bacterium]
MFIRFVSGEIDEDSKLPLGLFQSAYDALEKAAPPDYESVALNQTLQWFDANLKVPFDYRLRPRYRAEHSLCWFRSTAREHLAHAWEIVMILEEWDIYVRCVRFREIGQILYQDEVQVLAFPDRDMRRRFRR